MTPPITTQKISSLVDLTLLSCDAKSDDIRELASKGEKHHVAALCVLPQHLNDIPEIIASIARATVVNFPTGQDAHQDVLRSIEQITDNHIIHEIDYVFPYHAYLKGDINYALSCCSEVQQRCQEKGLLFKVILETGALPSTDFIYELSCDIINQGCDFLKTSTGKIKQGATMPAVTAMLSAIIDLKAPCGIKISGGIKTVEQALNYIHLAENRLKKDVTSDWFRLGASSLLDALENN